MEVFIANVSCQRAAPTYARVMEARAFTFLARDHNREVLMLNEAREKRKLSRQKTFRATYPWHPMWKLKSCQKSYELF